jgi:hypothetical protein
LGKDAPNASVYDWRMALSFAIRDRIVEPWFASTRRTWAEDRKRVYYLSMEFLIGGFWKMPRSTSACATSPKRRWRLRSGLPRDRRKRTRRRAGQWRPWPAGGLLHGKHGHAGLPGLWLRHPL